MNADAVNTHGTPGPCPLPSAIMEILLCPEIDPQIRQLFALEKMSHPDPLNKAFTARYTFHWNKGYEFSFLPQDEEDFKILEGMEMAKHQVRVAIDACDMAAKATREVNRKEAALHVEICEVKEKKVFGRCLVI